MLNLTFHVAPQCACDLAQERLEARVNLGADLTLIMPVLAEVGNGIHARNRWAGKYAQGRLP